MEEPTAQKKDIQKKLNKIIKERDTLNKDAKSQKQIRDKLNEGIKETLNHAIECRDKRDKINQEVEKYKKLRDEINKKIQTIEWTTEKAIDIQKEIERIDKTPQPKVGNVKSESEIIKRIQNLSKQLQEPLEDKEAQKEAVKLNELAKSYHNKVVELSTNSQNIHQEMLSYFQKTDEIRSNADKVHHKFIEIRSNASKKHAEVKKCLNQIKTIKQKPNRRNVKQVNNTDKGKEEAVSVYKKFKEGKKLNHRELLLFQKYNII